jgi:hypothetical protein
MIADPVVQTPLPITDNTGSEANKPTAINTQPTTTRSPDQDKYL